MSPLLRYVSVLLGFLIDCRCTGLGAPWLEYLNTHNMNGVYRCCCWISSRIAGVKQADIIRVQQQLRNFKVHMENVLAPITSTYFPPFAVVESSLFHVCPPPCLFLPLAQCRSCRQLCTCTSMTSVTEISSSKTWCTRVMTMTPTSSSSTTVFPRYYTLSEESLLVAQDAERELLE